MKSWKLLELLNTPFGLVVALGLLIAMVELLIMLIIHPVVAPLNIPFDSSTMEVADIKALTDVTSMPNVSVEFDKDTSKYQLYKTQNYFALCKKESCEASKSENSSSFLAIQQGGSPSSEVVLRSPEGIIF